jgi:hypothetical protein
MLMGFDYPITNIIFIRAGLKINFRNYKLYPRKGFEPLRGVIHDIKRLCDLILIIP